MDWKTNGRLRSALEALNRRAIWVTSVGLVLLTFFAGCDSTLVSHEPLITEASLVVSEEGNDVRLLADSRISGVVEIVVDVADKSVARVEFYVDRAQAGGQPPDSVDESSPFGMILDTTLLVDGPHVLSAVASNRGGKSKDTATVSFVVDNAPTDDDTGNAPPTVDAGPDQVAAFAEAVVLNGTVSDDGVPGTGLSWSWRQADGPAIASIEGADTLDPTVTPVMTGTYVFELAASDGESTAIDAMTVEWRTEGAPPPDGTIEGITLPARGAFYYPWYPETWTVNGSHVSYQPYLGYYDSDDVAVVDQHIDAMEFAKIDVAIASWWGPGTHNESQRIPLLLNRSDTAKSPLKWAMYYEKEGFGDPSPAELENDLAYLETQYALHASYARIDGIPIIFVYNADDASCEVADRWRDAAGDRWYVVLKVFSGYRDCAAQPASWHQYSPASAAGQQDGYAYYISPGFWRADEPTPRLERDLGRWNQNVRDMVASNEPWQLVTTFNEWGEGTAIEGANEWASSGQGEYLDALARDGADPTGDAPAPDPETPIGTVTFAVAGDIGGKEDRAGIVLPAAEAEGVEFFVATGDMSYAEITPESAWCDWVKSKFAGPFQIVTGNHEDDSRVDGYILDFADCLPDRMNSTLGPGGYAVSYFFDAGPVRVIAISADLVVAGIHYDYAQGSEQRAWLQEAIRTAPGWTVVAAHKPCLTIGNKSCEIGDGLMDVLHSEGVDLLVFGHDHDYQRSHALSCADPNVFRSECVADSGSDGEYARNLGTVHVIAGTVGRSPTTCNHSDSEAPYFAAHRCAEESVNSQGYLLVHASDSELRGEFVGVFDGYRDGFVIR